MCFESNKKKQAGVSQQVDLYLYLTIDLGSLDGFSMWAPYLTFDLDQEIRRSLSFLNNMSL